MSAAEDRRALAELVASLASPPADPASLGDATPLVGDGLRLDSVALLELVVLVEERLGVVLATDDVGSEAFATFGRLVALVARRRGEASPGEAGASA